MQLSGRLSEITRVTIVSWVSPLGRVDTLNGSWLQVVLAKSRFRVGRDPARNREATGVFRRRTISEWQLSKHGKSLE